MKKPSREKSGGDRAGDVERAFLHEQAEAGGMVLVRCVRCHATTRRGSEEVPFSVRPRHRPSCPLDNR